MLHRVESIMIILFYEYLSSLSPPYSYVLTMLLWSCWIDTCNNNFGTNYVSERPSIDTLRK